MMKKQPVWTFIPLIFFCLFLSGTAFALKAVNAVGKPVNASGARFELWRGEGGWHLRWTGGGQNHHFFGKIMAADGNIVITSRTKLESNDRVWKEGNGIRFDAWATGGFDGFDFHWSGKELIVDIEIDGTPSYCKIFVGRNGIHPVQRPFIIRRQPEHRPGRARHWVPGHYDRYGRWIPGHLK